MRGWISSVDRTSKRVFKIAASVMFVVSVVVALGPGMALPTNTWEYEVVGILFLALFGPALLVGTIYGIIYKALREPDSLTALFDLEFEVFSVLMFAANALLWATIITTAFVLVRRFRPRRSTLAVFLAVAAATYAATVAQYAAALHGSGCCDTLVGALLWLTLPGVLVLASLFSVMAEFGYIVQANLLVPVVIIIAPITAAFWATLVTLAYIIVRRRSERRLSSKET